ncbi:hypothetical protein acdb102_20110 [Acidothermaceae bacterium B102]|nr:hypothetical protein acdb102_20110 [Acidothermaceae bacterium B102]
MLTPTQLRRYAPLSALALLLSVTGATTVAAAATKPAAHVKAVAAPATVAVGDQVTVTGSVSPKAATTVLVQRLVGKKWTTVGHTKTAKNGAYTLTLHAPTKPAALTLRVTRAASASATLHVRVVKAAFHVTAQPAVGSVTTAQPVVVSGKVSPRGKGSVSLDRLVGARWVSLGKATLTAGSAYSLSTTLAAGSYRLRVSKPFTTTVAGGVSKTFEEVVTTPTTPPTAPPTTPGIVVPVVSTTTLTGATVGAAFHQTLAATAGTAPYTWSVASGSLPTGLSLLPDGDVFGTPVAVATFSFTVRATDALGHSGTGSVTAIVHAVGVRSWGYGLNGEYGDGTHASTLAISAASLPGTTTTVAGGDNFALALQADGTVYAWGVNTFGQLGVGDTNPRYTPVLVTTLSNVTAIAAGVDASYAVTSNGTLYSWGNDAAGQLGNGTASNTPTLVPTAITLANVVSVAAGNQFALALTGNSAVYGFGADTFGVVGDGSTLAQVTTPTRASISTPDRVYVTAVAAGQAASYALLSDGTVQSWGLKEHGQLGNVTMTGMGTVQPTPVPVTGLSTVTALACNGFEFCLALHTNHTVSAWGYGVTGEMGDGGGADSTLAAAVPGLTDITSIAAAHTTAYAVHANGTVSSWGYDGSNELGNGDATNSTTLSPALIPGLTGVVGAAAGAVDGYALQAR